MGRGTCAGARVVFVAAAWVFLACEITVPCPPGEEVTVPIPSGTFAPAVVHHGTSTVGAPFFSSTFPRGAADPTLAVSTVVPDDRPTYDASGYVAVGEAVSSAMLRIDQAARMVVRSYVSAEGRLIEERWRFKGDP